MIELKNAVKKFEGDVILKGISLSIKSGSAYGLLGSNGAGKSTILRMLSGIYKPDGGEVLIDGQAVWENVAVKQRVFFINDETVQFSSYTLKQLRNYYRSYYPNFSDELFEKLRERIGLSPDKKISTFSKGMKRQAVVIIGLACRTDYLLLDEAFDGLDPTMRNIVKKMLVDAMIDRSLTVVISSHNLKEISEICDSAALIHNGEIVFASELDDIRSSLHKVQAVFNRETTDESFLSKEGIASLGLEVMHFERSMSVCHIIIKGDEERIKTVLAEKDPVVLDIVPLTLEEIFIYELEVLGYDSSDINI